jgi:hypothetical protein
LALVIVGPVPGGLVTTLHTYESASPSGSVLAVASSFTVRPTTAFACDRVGLATGGLFVRTVTATESVVV